MPYCNFVADSFHTTKLCGRFSSSEMRFWTKIGRFAFLSPLGNLRATYDGHLRLIGKCVGDFPLLSQCTRLTERRTDGRTEFSSLDTTTKAGNCGTLDLEAAPLRTSRYRVLLL